MSALGHTQTYVAQNAVSALPPKATLEQSRTVREQRNCPWQNYPDFGELAGLCVDLDRPRMLLDDDVVTDGEAKAGAFPSWLGRKKWIEHLLPDLWRNTGAVVADADLHTVAEAPGHCGQGRLVAASICFRLTLGRRIEAV